VATEKRSLSIEARVTDLASTAFTKMLGSARAFAGGAIPLFKATAVAFGTISVAVTGAFIAFRKYSEGLDKIAKVSDKFGVTAESLTAIRDGAELAGIDIDKLATSMKSFELAVSKANDGSKEQRETFQSLGLASEQFAGDQLNIVDVLSKVAGGLEGVSSASERTRILVALFGKTGADLAPLLKEGSDGIQRMAAEAKAAGAVFTREELARVEQFNDSWTKLQQTFRTLAERLVVDLSPAITELFESLNTVFRENAGEIRGAFLDLLSVLVEGFQVMKTVFDTIFLMVNGWKGLVLSMQLFKAEMVGTVQEQRKANQAFYEQGRILGELSEGWGATTQSVEAMRAALDRLRKTPQAPATIKPPKVLVGSEDDQTQVLPNAWDKFLEGAAKAREQWTDFTQAAMDSGQRLVGGTLDSLTGAIATGLEGTKSWGRAWKDWGQQVRGIITSVIAKLLVVRALSGLSSLFGGTATTTPAPTVADGAAVGGGVGGAVGGSAGVGALSAGGSTPRFTLLPGTKAGAAPASPQSAGPQIVINMSFSSIDPKGSFEIIKQNKDQIIAIVASAMQRSNAFRGTVKEASS